MICAVIKGPDIFEVRKQIDLVQDQVDLLELRLDLWDRIDLPFLESLKSEYAKPLIFTLRSPQHGGAFRGSERERQSLLRQLAALNPEYIDFEVDIPEEWILQMQKDYPAIQVILSYHNFKEIPVDLDSIYENMVKIPAAIYKLAVMPASMVDTLKFLSWAISKRDILSKYVQGPISKSMSRLLAVCMGEAGQVSRIIGPLHDNPFTYASLGDHLGSAPGQLNVDMLREHYHYPSLSLSSKLYGLIGSPITMSVSDLTHTRILRSQGIDAVYVKMRVEPPELESYLEYAKKNLVCGLSVTMPLKEAIVPFMDGIDHVAKDIGAVNTLVFKNGKVKGYNTDGMGALNAIERKVKVKNKRVLILGAGGAAKAIAYEAYRRGASLTIVNRDVEKAKLLANSYAAEYYGIHEMATCYDKGYDIFVNTTSIELPIDPKYLCEKSVVMDIKTKPKKTQLLQAAVNKQLAVIYGYEMFIEQALGQFALWFDDELDLHACRVKFEEMFDQFFLT